MEDKKNEKEEVDESISEVMDFTKPNYEFIPQGSHEFSQRGPYLICRSCDLEHATYIGMDQIMTGLTEDGKPILKNRYE